MHSSLKTVLNTIHLFIAFLQRCYAIFAAHATPKVDSPDLVIVDFETGGLNPREHEILEIGVVRVDARTLQEVSRLSIKVKPTRPVPPEAAKINGYNEKDWVNAVSLREGLEALFLMVKGARWVGSKPSFDWDFAVAGAEKEGLPLPKLASHRKVDISGMAEPLVSIGLIEGAGVDNLVQFFNLPFERGVHRAIVDAEATLAIYGCLLKIYAPATIFALVIKIVSESEEMRDAIVEALLKAVPAAARSKAS
jgi:DNA polymerase III epsilon subunit-like protein